ncbi:hypothetical protein D3C85_1473410 [compost metagenome]
MAPSTSALLGNLGNDLGFMPYGVSAAIWGGTRTGSDLWLIDDIIAWDQLTAVVIKTGQKRHRTAPDLRHFSQDSTKSQSFCRGKIDQK